MNINHSNTNPDSPQQISNGVDLSAKRCIPCEAGVAPLSRKEAEVLLKQVQGWELSSDAKALRKTFKFKNWKEAMQFTNAVSDIAESEGHHPDIDLHWGKVDVTLSTHAIQGLSQNDFILAAKIDNV